MPKLCVALDVDRKRALDLIDRLSEYPIVFKVGPRLFLDGGREIIDEVKTRKREAFLDLKLHDIPNTVKIAVQKAEELGVDYLTLHTLGGERMMEWAVSERNRIKLLGVTILTSHDESYLNFLRTELSSLKEMVLYLAGKARECGLDGVVCSAKEVREVKEKTELLTVVPGIRLGGETQDQVRVLTPEKAVSLGADMIVMGREIYGSSKPERVVEEVLRRIEKLV